LLATASAKRDQQVAATIIAACGAGMARKKGKARTIASTRIADEELIARLQEEAPDVLTTRVSEADFDAVVADILKEPPFAGDNPHFYCRQCGGYHLKTHPHFARMKQRTKNRQGLAHGR
jgi:hypothetical protein